MKSLSLSEELPFTWISATLYSLTWNSDQSTDVYPYSVSSYYIWPIVSGCQDLPGAWFWHTVNSLPCQLCVKCNLLNYVLYPLRSHQKWLVDMCCSVTGFQELKKTKITKWVRHIRTNIFRWRVKISRSGVCLPFLWIIPSLLILRCRLFWGRGRGWERAAALKHALLRQAGQGGLREVLGKSRVVLHGFVGGAASEIVQTRLPTCHPSQGPRVRRNI